MAPNELMAVARYVNLRMILKFSDELMFKMIAIRCYILSEDASFSGCLENQSFLKSIKDRFP